MPFTQRLLRVTFELGQNLITGAQPVFAEGANVLPDLSEVGNVRLTLTGLRMSATVVKAGGFTMNSLQLRVYGMTPSQMNNLSTLGQLVTLVGKNSVLVEAGTDLKAMATVFSGTITNAWVNLDSMPEVSFEVVASTGTFEAIAKADPSSFPHAVSVVDILSGLAKQMNLTLEVHGNISVTLSACYLPGTARNQAIAAAIAANINVIQDDGKLVVWPKGRALDDTVIPISPANGMIGYPSFTQNGIMLRTLFNPSIRYASLIEVDSSLSAASGQFSVYSLTHNLESMVPNGQWFSSIAASILAAPIRPA